MSNDQREPLRVLVFSASLRAESLNTRLASFAATVIERLGASVDLASMDKRAWVESIGERPDPPSTGSTP